MVVVMVEGADGERAGVWFLVKNESSYFLFFL